MTRVRRVPLLVAALLATGWFLTGIVTAGPAAAHATLVTTSPGEGARLESAPAEVTLEFSEGVTLGAGYARVLTDDGRRVDSGSASVTDDLLTIPLRGGLPDAGYVVTYRVVSADGHPISGAYSFVVGAGEVPAAGAVPAPDETDPVVAAALPAARWAGFAGLALSVGVPVFALFCWPPGWAVARLRRLAVGGAVTVAVAGLATFLLQGPYAGATGIGSLLDPALLRTTAASGAGSVLLIRAVVALWLAAVLAQLWRRGEVPVRSEIAVAGALMAGLLVSAAAVGHPVAGPWPGLAVAVAVVHAAAMAVWLGGLAALLAAVLRPGLPSGELAVAVPRFSAIAFVAVTALVGSGILQSVREVGSPTALVSSSYGGILITKLVLVLVALASAGVSRVWVQQRLGAHRPRPGGRRRTPAHAFAAAPGPVAVVAGRESGQGTGPENPTIEDAADARGRALAEEAVVHVPALRRSVLAELAVAVGILALSAMLVGTPPARSALAQPVDVTLPMQGSAGAVGSVQVSVDPARPGPNTLHLYLFDDTGRLTQPAGIRASLTEEQQSIGPLDVELQPAGPGHYIGEGMSVPGAGTWALTVTARLDEFTATTATTTFPVR